MKATDLKNGDMVYALDLTQCKVSVHIVNEVKRVDDKNSYLNTFQLSGIGTRKFSLSNQTINPTIKDINNCVDCVFTPYGSSKKYMIFTKENEKLARTILVEYAYQNKLAKAELEVESSKESYLKSISDCENLMHKIEKDRKRLNKL